MNKTFTRRDALKLGLLTGGALLLPLGIQQRGSAASPKTTAFQLPLKIPPVLTPVNRDATTDYQAAFHPSSFKGRGERRGD